MCLWWRVRQQQRHVGKNGAGLLKLALPETAAGQRALGCTGAPGKSEQQNHAILHVQCAGELRQASDSLDDEA